MRRGAIVGILLVTLLGAGAVPGSAATAGPNPCVGTIKEPPDSVTVISTQGARLAERGAHKRPARLVGVSPSGDIRWVYHASRDQGIVWAYDVDPMADGNVFVTATKRKQTVFFVLDPATGEVVWREQVDLIDTHDADLLDDHRILIANMRNYDPEAKVNNERLTIYNRTTDEFVWEWRFDEHFPRDGGLNYTGDWTHVNDVDRIAPGKYLASVRNFDQVIVVDRASGEIVHRLGQEGRQEIIDEQHNPQYLESESGRPTLLIADSRNGRVVEYELGPLGWQRTWRLGSADTLAWPRDADRLPDGNTLVTDSANNRVMEVTPGGNVVWEFYAPWLVYDAERMALGDEPGGPTIADQGAGGAYELRDAEPWKPKREQACATFLREWSSGTPTPTNTATPPPTTVPPTVTPTVTPTASPTPTTSTPGQPGFGLLLGAVALLATLVIARYRE